MPGLSRAAGGSAIAANYDGDMADALRCKSCSEELRLAQAHASIFALSFLPVRGRKIDRVKKIRIASEVGPLCPKCLERRKDLAHEKPPVGE